MWAFLRPTLTGGAVDACLPFFGGLGTARRHSVRLAQKLNVDQTFGGRSEGAGGLCLAVLVGVTADDYDGFIGYFHGLRLV